MTVLLLMLHVMLQRTLLQQVLLTSVRSSFPMQSVLRIRLLSVWNTFGTGKLSETKLVEIVRENFDLRPAGIIKMLDLRRPIYKQTAAYGHFGRTDVDLPWEHLDKVENLKKYLG